MFCQSDWLGRYLHLSHRIRRALDEIHETLDETHEQTLANKFGAYASTHRLVQRTVVASVRGLRVDRLAEFSRLNPRVEEISRLKRAGSWRTQVPFTDNWYRVAFQRAMYRAIPPLSNRPMSSSPTVDMSFLSIPARQACDP